MKVLFNGNEVEMKKAEPTTKLTKKQIEAIRLFAKAKTINYINNLKKNRDEDGQNRV
jgi:hypothetical protein